MFLEGLLGGITGATGAIGKDIETQRSANVKAQQDKKDWMRDVMKGIMLQQMRKGSNDFDWEGLVGDTSDLYDPEFLRKILGGFQRNRTSSPGQATPRQSPGGINPSGGVITDY